MPLSMIGDSHVATLKLAWLKHNDELRPLCPDGAEFLMLGNANALYEPFFVDEGTALRITTETVAERARQFQAGDGTVRVAAGDPVVVAAGLHTSTLLGGVWTQHAPWRTKPVATRTAMSDAVFRTIVLDAHQHVLAFLAALRARTEALHVLSAPPPTERFALFELGYDADDVVMMDAMARAFMREAIGALGVPVIEPPAETQEGGFLKPQYLMDDVKDRHHGNVAYSRLVLRTVFEAVVRPSGGASYGEPRAATGTGSA